MSARMVRLGLSTRSSRPSRSIYSTSGRRLRTDTLQFHTRTNIRSSDSDPTLSSSFSSGPAPPKLPKKDQEIFETLQRSASLGPTIPVQALDSDSQSRLDNTGSRQDVDGVGSSGFDSRMLHPDVRAAVPPDFEGDKNPKTGEVGGPKNEPLRWGSAGDWSYGGRVTDF